MPGAVSITHSTARPEGTAAIPDERARLATVRSFEILDTPPDAAFDRIVWLAAETFGMPMAFLSIVDADRIWLKSAFGMDARREFPREPGLCGSAIGGREPYVVERADTDPRCSGNALVTGPAGVRFYAGIPLVAGDGSSLGTLSVAGREPHHADTHKLRVLSELGKIAVDELEHRVALRRLLFNAPRRMETGAENVPSARSTHVDELTELANHRALEAEIDALSGDGVAIVVLLEGLHEVNVRRGRDVGDRLVRAFADALRATFKETGRIYRYDGDEFAVFLRAAAVEDPLAVQAGVGDAVFAVREAGFPEAAATAGAAAYSKESGVSPRAALRQADSKMYAERIARR